jgi:dephospho-CoA kinase
MRNILELYNKLLILKASIVVLIVLLTVDLLNIPTTIYDFGGMTLLIAIGWLLLIKIIELYLKDLFKMMMVNYSDFFNLVLFIASVLYSCSYCFSEYPTNIYKIYSTLVLIIITILVFFIRGICIIRNYKKNEVKTKKSNVLDLKDIYDNKFPPLENSLFFVDEKAVDYDLLKRKDIISDLYMTIKECRTDKQYVIAITGEWGSGKTTLINNVKSLINKTKNHDMIVIDNFDPWIYEDKTAMFRAMFDTIISKSGMNFRTNEIKRLMNRLTTVIFGITKIKGITLDNDSNKEIDRIRKMINSYLLANNKRIVFIVDNIERANKENILLLFKSIGSIFNFDRIIYLISYDKDRLKGIFKSSLETDYEYIDKIIQHEITVPNISKDTLYQINMTVIKNLFTQYGLNKKEQSDFEYIIKEYSKDIKNIRYLKRNINSIINSNFVNNNYLNKVDAFIIKYISLKNRGLVDSIYDNRNYYVSEDYSLYNDEVIYNNQAFNKTANEYFESTFIGENSKYITMLSKCFPNVEKYKNRRSNEIPQYRETGSYIFHDQNDYIIKTKEKHICSGKFFDLYFTSTRNEFLEIDIAINDFLKSINSQQMELTDCINEISELINMFGEFGQQYILETLQFYIGDIKQNRIQVAFCIYNFLRYLNNKELFFGTNARRRGEILMSDLLYCLDEIEFSEFLKHIRKDYKNLYIIREIGHWLNSEKENKYNDDKTEYYKRFDEVYEKMKCNIIDTNINIYEENNYGIHNVYCFFDDEVALKNISEKIDDTNIFRFLCDMIGVSVGSSYGYKILQEKVKKVMLFDTIDEILQGVEPKNDKEKFILEVYNNRKDEGDEFIADVKRKEYFNYDLSNSISRNN